MIFRVLALRPGLGPLRRAARRRDTACAENPPGRSGVPSEHVRRDMARVCPVKALLESMKERHWVEGRDFVLDVRSAGGRYARVQGLVAGLVAQKVDVLLFRTLRRGVRVYRQERARFRSWSERVPMIW